MGSLTCTDGAGVWQFQGEAQQASYSFLKAKGPPSRRHSLWKTLRWSYGDPLPARAQLPSFAGKVPSTVKKKKGPPIIGQNEIGTYPFSPLREAQSLGKGKSERESTTTYDGLLVSGPVVPAAAWHPGGFSLVLWAIRTLAALKHSLWPSSRGNSEHTHTHTHTCCDYMHIIFMKQYDVWYILILSILCHVIFLYY